MRTPWIRPNFGLENTEVTVNAFNSIGYGSDRGRCSALAGQQLHPYAGDHQVNPECRRGDWSSLVAAQHFWIVSFVL
jgi:hypothetical protein